MRNFSANYSAKRKVEQIENRESVLRRIFGRSIYNAQFLPTHLDKCRAESSMKNENNLSTDSHGIFSPAKDGFAVFEAKTISTETDHVQVFVPPGCGSLHCFSGGKFFFPRSLWGFVDVTSLERSRCPPAAKAGSFPASSSSDQVRGAHA